MFFSPYFSEQSFCLKRYLNAIDSSSFWYGGQILVGSADNFNDYYNDALNMGTVAISGITGYQFIIKSWYIDIMGGLGYALTNDLYGAAFIREETAEPSKMVIIFTIKVGMAF